MYGPDSLGAYGTPEDTITYGLDNIFANQTGTKSTTGLAAYQGIGAVNFSYGISGGLTTLKGGLNYNQKIVTDYEGSFILRYFWCANALLGSNITNFVVSKKEDDIQLNWSAVNQDKVNQYVVEYSTDGINYQTAGESLPLTGEYNIKHYTFDIRSMLYRIRMEKQDGRFFNSAVFLLDGDDHAPVKIYPTMIEGNTINMQLWIPIERISVFSSSGQQVFAKEMGGFMGSTQVVIPSLSKGTYMITFYGILINK